MHLLTLVWLSSEYAKTIFAAIFRIGIDSPDFVFLPKGFYSINLFVVPMWGLYANMIAQLMSQISSHFILHYHRKVVHNAKEEYKRRHLQFPTDINVSPEQPDVGQLAESDVAPDQKLRLGNYLFTRPLKEQSDKVAVRRWINYLLPVSGSILCVLLAICCAMPSLQLEAFGVLALMIEVGGKLREQAVRTESIFSMASSFVEQAEYLDKVKDYIGLGFLAFLWMTTLLIVPVIQIITLVFLWVFPITGKRRKKVAVFLEILQAWQYVEVYILGIVIMSWQLGNISKLLLNRYCESINDILIQLASYGLIDNQDAQCFEMVASITSGAYLLVPFVLGLALLNTYVVKAYVQYLQEKKHEAEAVTEEDKLRAFDRTTWDNRMDALENIRPVPVVFTDLFRWTLWVQPNTSKMGEKLLVVEENEDGTQVLTAAATYALPDTSSSGDEENTAAQGGGTIVPLPNDEASSSSSSGRGNAAAVTPAPSIGDSSSLEDDFSADGVDC